MKTCKDCIHYKVCEGYLPTDLDEDIWDLCAEGKSDEIHNIDERCDQFKDKSKFIELPCSIGDYCIYYNDLWYVNNITYCCDSSFLLWISMADKSPCCAEVIASEVKFISNEEAERKLKAFDDN